MQFIGLARQCSKALCAQHNAARTNFTTKPLQASHELAEYVVDAVNQLYPSAADIIRKAATAASRTACAKLVEAHQLATVGGAGGAGDDLGERALCVCVGQRPAVVQVVIARRVPCGAMPDNGLGSCAERHNPCCKALAGFACSHRRRHRSS
jgi:hypothetical protein